MHRNTILKTLLLANMQIMCVGGAFHCPGRELVGSKPDTVMTYWLGLEIEVLPD